MATAHVASVLAGNICGFNANAVSENAWNQAHAAIVDTIAVTLGGVCEPCTRIMLETPGVGSAPGQSLILGTRRRTSALDATLVNGVASHALDYDDFSGAMGGHHSTPVVPALFALGEERKVPGRRLVLAYLAGVETEVKIGRAVQFHHYDKGWHPTSTLGVFGAAAAAAYLLSLDQRRTAMALAIAASLASGLKGNFGTMSKPLHVGQCGRNGLMAALLAEKGMTGNPEVFEHPQGFFNVYNGPGTFDAARATVAWTKPLEVEDPGIAFKPYPCCGSSYPALAASLALVRDHAVRADDLARVEILPHVRRLRHTDNSDPRTSMEAKFSVQYIVARALSNGAISLAHFENNAYDDPAIRRIIALTEARPHPDMRDDSPQHWSAEVAVTLKNGRRLAKRIDSAVAPGGEQPVSRQVLWDKFRDCASRALPQARLRPLFERLISLAEAPSMTDVAEMLAGQN